MKAEIHPNLREVVFKDGSSGWTYKTLSTVRTKETINWEDGNEYPLHVVEISSASHPFYTGKQRLVDTEGRAEKFNRRFKRKSTQQEG
ncbi:MAG: 50S ribosomal protein L31 [Bdellovibrionaceae bacterium]|nr:50S ribosomal protein L31 [Pseudobdellovibrionaceae bacterium]